MKRKCPNCGSLDVKPSFSNPSTTVEGGRDDWECNECGYVGLMPSQMPDEELEQTSEEDFEDREYPRVSVSSHKRIDTYFLILLFLAFIFIIILDKTV